MATEMLPLILGTFRETDAPLGESGTVQVVLLSPGPGNIQDGNCYVESALAKAPAVFNSCRSFLDHPGRDEEQNRPERSVREQAGWFSDVRVGPDGALMGTLTLGGAGAEAAKKTIEAALRFQKEFPDKVWSGLSINADGSFHPETTEVLVKQYPQWRDRLERRDVWNVVDEFTRVSSCDIVTLPARGGKFLSLTEAEAEISARRTTEASKGAKPKTQAIPPEVAVDLRKKVDEVEESHKPETIAALLKAIRAFLGEEEIEAKTTASGAEASREGESTMATEAKKKEESTCEACGHKMEARREEEEESKREAKREEEEEESKREGKREAKREEEEEESKREAKREEEEEESKRESRKKKEAKKAAPPADAGEPDADDMESKRKETHKKESGLDSNERVELEQLRMKEAQRTKASKAETTIREAGVDGLITTDRLMSFHESQWPTLIDFARAQNGPNRSYGSGQINMPAPTKAREAASPIDVVNAAYEASA